MKKNEGIRSNGISCEVIDPWSFYSIANYGSTVIKLKDNDTTMKEQKLERFEITFKETRIIEHTYCLLAESKEDALKKIQEKSADSDSKTISIEIVEIK